MATSSSWRSSLCDVTRRPTKLRIRASNRVPEHSCSDVNGLGTASVEKASRDPAIFHARLSHLFFFPPLFLSEMKSRFASRAETRRRELCGKECFSIVRNEDPRTYQKILQIRTSCNTCEPSVYRRVDNVSSGYKFVSRRKCADDISADLFLWIVLSLAILVIIRSKGSSGAR